MTAYVRVSLVSVVELNAIRQHRTYRDVGMLDPVIYCPNACRMHYHDSIRAVDCYIPHELIAERIRKRRAVERLRRIRVDEHQTRIRIGIYRRVDRVKIPSQDPSVLLDPALDRLKRTHDVRRSAGAAATACYHRSIESVPAEVDFVASTEARGVGPWRVGQLGIVAVDAEEAWRLQW